jgi:hypothetical protein
MVNSDDTSRDAVVSRMTTALERARDEGYGRVYLFEEDDRVSA